MIDLFARETARFVRERVAAAPTRAQRWALLEANGLTTLAVPEAAGGQGAGGIELAVLGGVLGAELDRVGPPPRRSARKKRPNTLCTLA